MHRIVVYHVGPFRFQAIFTQKITYVSRQRILYFRFVFCFVFFSSHLRPKSCPPSGRKQEGLIFQVVCLRRYPAIWECASLNPLPRTIQGNDPGTTACPPCAD